MSNGVDNSKKVLNVPNLRFNEFNGEWLSQRLNQLVSIHARIGWQGLRQSEFLDKGDIYLITGTDFDNGHINFVSCKFIDKQRFDQDKNIQIKNNDLLITKDGSIGKIAYVESLTKNATLNAGVYRVRVENNIIDSRYLFHYLNGNRLMNFANKQMTGGTIKHLNQSSIINMPIRFPSPIEQIKIDKLLDLIEARIKTQNKIIESYESLIKSLRETILYKKEWKWTKLKVLVDNKSIELQRGNIIPKHVYDSRFIYPVYSSSIHNDGLMGFNDSYMFDDELITWSIDGGGNFFLRNKHKFNVTNVCGILKIIDDSLDYSFLYEILSYQHSRMTFDYQTKAHPSVIQTIYSVPLIELKEQKKIGSIFRPLYGKIKIEKDILEHYKLQKEYLLKNLFI